MEEAKKDEKTATKSPTGGASDEEEEAWNQSVKGLSEEEKAASALLHNIKSKGKNSVSTFCLLLAFKGKFSLISSPNHYVFSITTLMRQENLRQKAQRSLRAPDLSTAGTQSSWA